MFAKGMTWSTFKNENWTAFSGIGMLSSNPGSICYLHFATYALRKGMKRSILLLPAPLMYTRPSRLVWKQYRRRGLIWIQTQKKPNRKLFYYLSQEIMKFTDNKEKEYTESRVRDEGYNSKINLLHLSLTIQTS